jgi:hypothetical protein
MHSIPIAIESKPFALFINIKSMNSNKTKLVHRYERILFTTPPGIIKYMNLQKKENSTTVNAYINIKKILLPIP